MSLFVDLLSNGSPSDEPYCGCRFPLPVQSCCCYRLLIGNKVRKSQRKSSSSGGRRPRRAGRCAICARLCQYRGIVRLI